jgi:hypothetical protein
VLELSCIHTRPASPDDGSVPHNERNPAMFPGRAAIPSARARASMASLLQPCREQARLVIGGRDCDRVRAPPAFRI